MHTFSYIFIQLCCTDCTSRRTSCQRLCLLEKGRVMDKPLNRTELHQYFVSDDNVFAKLPIVQIFTIWPRIKVSKV